MSWNDKNNYIWRLYLIVTMIYGVEEYAFETLIRGVPKNIVI